MKLTLQDGGYTYSVEMPEDTLRDDFIANAQPILDAVWSGSVQLVEEE